MLKLCLPYIDLRLTLYVPNIDYVVLILVAINVGPQVHTMALRSHQCRFDC